MIILSQAKHFSFFIICFNKQHFLISKVSSSCFHSVISAELSSFPFACCYNNLFNFVSFLKSRQHKGDIWQFLVQRFSHNGTAFVKNKMKILKTRWTIFNSCSFFGIFFDGFKTQRRYCWHFFFAFDMLFIQRANIRFVIEC